MPAREAPTKQRVTQSDIARAAGVHNTTVSLSLRNCPCIPEATRERIRIIATEMGYHPDPTLQALVAYRKGRLSNRRKETLAYLTDWDTRWGWRASPAYERAYIGAQRKAVELGYQLEHFWLGEPGMNPRRMSSLLYNRGITGVLIACGGELRDEHSEFEWSRFSAVMIGGFHQAPALHRVTDDHGGIIRLAMRKMLGAGFERIGLVSLQRRDVFADQAWSAGYLIAQEGLTTDASIPILRLGGSGPERLSAHAAPDCSNKFSALGTWYRHYRPEVIAGFTPAVLGKIEQLGLAIPRDVFYVDLCLECADQRVAGVRHNRETVGEVAARILVGQLQQNLLGPPAVATTTTVDGTWIDGASLPTISAPRKCEASDDKIKVPVEFADSSLLVSA